MTKVYLLGANKEIDRAEQVVEVNQVIQMEGYSYHSYVVYDITKNQWGITYKLIDLTTKDFHTADIIRPLKEKFGIGFYYDSDNPQFMDSLEVAMLLQEAQQKANEEAEAEEKERIKVEEIKKIGRVRFAEILPEDAQAVIVARLKQDESDSQTDYFASSTQRTIILGFSKHKRDIFSEMRKHASNFEETAFLAEYNADYEHREKYSMGAYYLGESKYSGWIILKDPIYNREQAIERFAYTAGDANNIHIKKTVAKGPKEPVTTQVSNKELQFEIVDYSEKAIALFGDTKPIKDLLLAMGGKFNPRLTHNAEKRAGWIFSINKRTEVETIINLNN